MADQVDFPEIYIDASVGDGGVGSQADPYNDFVDINWTTGDDNSVYDYINGTPSQDVTVNLKRGEVWHESFVPAYGISGVSGYDIVLQPYGAGAQPIINRSSEEAGWTLSSGYIYTKTLGGTPTVITEDDGFLVWLEWDTDVATTFSGASQGCWSSNGAVAYVWSTDDADPDTHTIECSFKAGDDRYGVYLLGSEYWVIDDIRAEKCTGTGILLQGNAGYGGIKNVTVTNCTCRLNGWDGIKLTENQAVAGFNDYVYFDGNTTDYNGQCGIRTGGGYTHGSIINHASSYCGWVGISPPTGGHGISLYGSSATAIPDGILVEYCVVHHMFEATDDSEGAGIQTDNYAEACIIRYNICYLNEGSGFYENGTSGNYWYYNLGYSNGEAGMSISDIGTCYVYNNVFYGNTGDGINPYAAISSGLYIKNNIIAENGGYEILVGVSATGTIDSDYNCVYHSAGGSFMRWRGTSYTWAGWQGAPASQDANSQNANPSFVNPGSADFALQPGSPCLSNATDVGLTEDIIGQAVPTGAGRDIGAYEFVGFTLAAAVGSHSLSGVGVNLEYGRTITVDAGSYALAGSTLDLLYGGEEVESLLYVDSRIAEFELLDDWEKLIIFEHKLARKLQEETWIQCGSPNTNVWHIDLLNDGEIFKVEEDGEEYTETFSIVLCHATASTFYYDDLTKRLYINTLDSDDPATLDGGNPKYNIVAYWWEYLSNRPYEFEPYSDLLEELNGNLEFWTSLTDADDWTETTAGTSTVVRESTNVFGNQSAYSAKLTGDGSNNQCEISRTDITLKPKRKARIRFMHYESTSGKTIKVMLKDSGSNVYLNASGEWQTSSCYILISNITDWGKIDVDFISHEDYSSYSFYIRNNNLSSASAYIDNVEVWRFKRKVDCNVFLPKGALPTISQSVGDYYQPDEQISFGSINVNNASGYYWTRRNIYGYLWHNRTAHIKAGKADDDYSDLAYFFTGILKNPKWGKIVEFSIEDERVLLEKIPTDRLDESTYPDCENEWKNRPMPICLGRVNDIKPPEIDISNHIFKPSQTYWGRITEKEYYMNDDCASLTGWTEENTGQGSMSAVEFDDKECFKFNVATDGTPATALASVHKTISGGLPLSYEMEFKFYGNYGFGDRSVPRCFLIEIWNGTFRLYVSIDSDEIEVYDGSSWNSTAVSMSHGEFITFKFIVDGTGQTVDIYKNNILVVNDADCSDTDATNDGKIQLTLAGDEVTYIQAHTDWIRVYVETVLEAGTNFALQAISAVYKTTSSGTKTTLTLTTDYTVDLTNGEFTVSATINDGDIITCDVLGIKIDFEDGTYSVLLGDFLYFLYTRLNSISKYKLDLASIINIKTNRLLECGIWISEEMESLDLLIKMKLSGVFQTIPRLDGQIQFQAYSADVPDDAPHYQVVDLIDHPKYLEDTDQCFKSAICKGQYLPNSGYYQYEEEEITEESDWNHKVKKQIEFETLLLNQFQLQNLVENYMSMIKNPPELIEDITLPSSALLLNPCDKFYLIYILKDENGDEITIYDNEVFRILSLDKNLNTGQVVVRALKDVSDFFWTIQ